MLKVSLFFKYKYQNDDFQFFNNWLFGFNVGLTLRNGLLPAVWDSLLSVVREHAVTIFILLGGEDTPALIARLLGRSGSRALNGSTDLKNIMPSHPQYIRKPFEKPNPPKY